MCSPLRRGTATRSSPSTRWARSSPRTPGWATPGPTASRSSRSSSRAGQRAEAGGVRAAGQAAGSRVRRPPGGSDHLGRGQRAGRLVLRSRPGPVPGRRPLAGELGALLGGDPGQRVVVGRPTTITLDPPPSSGSSSAACVVAHGSLGRISRRRADGRDGRPAPPGSAAARGPARPAPGRTGAWPRAGRAGRGPPARSPGPRRSVVGQAETQRVQRADHQLRSGPKSRRSGPAAKTWAEDGWPSVTTAPTCQQASSQTSVTQCPGWVAARLSST